MRCGAPSERPWPAHQDERPVVRRRVCGAIVSGRAPVPMQASSVEFHDPSLGPLPVAHGPTGSCVLVNRRGRRPSSLRPDAGGCPEVAAGAPPARPLALAGLTFAQHDCHLTHLRPQRAAGSRSDVQAWLIRTSVARPVGGRFAGPTRAWLSTRLTHSGVRTGRRIAPCTDTCKHFVSPWHSAPRVGILPTGHGARRVGRGARPLRNEPRAIWLLTHHAPLLPIRPIVIPSVSRDRLVSAANAGCADEPSRVGTSATTYPSTRAPPRREIPSAGSGQALRLRSG